MDLREEIQKRIARKEEEIREYELQIREGRAYIQALSDTLRFLPKTPATLPDPDMLLRAGTAMAKARDAIKKAGRPLHISEILKAIGRPVDRASRGSIGGSLSAYVRNGQVFTKVGPNTFGLVEMSTKVNSAPMATAHNDEPPESFGVDDISEPLANGKVEEGIDDDQVQR